MSKIEYRISYLEMWYVATSRYICTSPKSKLRNNIDVIDYFAGDNEIYEQTKERCSNGYRDRYCAYVGSQKSISAKAILTHLYYHMLCYIFYGSMATVNGLCKSYLLILSLSHQLVTVKIFIVVQTVISMLPVHVVPVSLKRDVTERHTRKLPPNSGGLMALSFPSPPLPSPPFPSTLLLALPSLPLSLEVGPPNAARGSGGAR